MYNIAVFVCGAETEFIKIENYESFTRAGAFIPRTQSYLFPLRPVPPFIGSVGHWPKCIIYQTLITQILPNRMSPNVDVRVP